MKLLVLSDLHRERHEPYALPDSFPPHDVAVVAGDIGSSPTAALAFLEEYLPSAGPIMFVPGNHEFYDLVVEDALERAKRLQKLYPRVRLLDADVVPVIDGVRFLGCTLWTDYNLNGDPALAMLAAEMGLNDHKLVGTRNPVDGKLSTFKARDALQRHRRERAWLEAQLAIEHDGPTVVVTHHGCSPGSVDSRHLGDRESEQLNPAFTSDLTDIIERYQPALWIHGHTHDSFDYMVGDTRVLCNPKGYGPEKPGGRVENPDFNPELVVDVPEFSPRPMP